MSILTSLKTSNSRDQSTVFLIDDDPAVCVALAPLMRAAGLELKLYRSAEDFLPVAESLTHGCLLMDVRLPSMSGPELQLALSASGFRLPIIFLTGHCDVSTSVRVMQAGAFDFLQKPVGGALLLERIHAALESDARRRQAEEERLLLQSRLGRLTAREREVMELVVHGYTNKQVGRQLGISHRTVEVYRGRVMQKLQVETLLELVVFAGACGSVSAPKPRYAALLPSARRQQPARAAA